MRLNITIFIVTLVLLSSCTETQLVAHAVKNIPSTSTIPSTSKSIGRFKVGSPYKIRGIYYTPKETYNFTQHGVASWYGAQFHGKQTANGEIFDMNELTAAHKTLQIPSIVRVTNLKNGRSLIVRVNDRGPFSKGRIIDLSKRSSELLGFKNQGTTDVKVELLAEESRAVAQIARKRGDTRGVEIALNEDRAAGRAMLNRRAGFASQPVKTAQATQAPSTTQTDARLQPVIQAELSPPAEDMRATLNTPKMPKVATDNMVKSLAVPDLGIYVQAGAFSNQGNAIKLADSFKAQGRNTHISPTDIKGTTFYRVRLGPLDNISQATQVIGDLDDAGYVGKMIVVK